MKASTLFALTIAILLGLGVAIAVKVSGIFNTPALPVAATPPPVKVLVAAKNIFAGDMVMPNEVYLRDLKPEEMRLYQQHKDDFLPPLQTAVALRIARKDIYTDQPLLKSDLEGLKKPDPLYARLVANMRAISLSVSKEESAGGIIQVGEWVDVLLTSTVTDGHGNSTTRTATVAPRVRVIAKRNSLWPVFTSLPEEKPIQFTLEVNPYRASMIEYVRSRGQLSLTPLPYKDQRELEDQRSVLLKQMDTVKQVHFIPAGTPEAEKEEAMVSLYTRGELVVNEKDLVSLFGLTTGAPPESNVAIEQLVGMNHYNPAMFNSSGKRLVPLGTPAAALSATGSAHPALGGFEFSAPGAGCQKKSK